MPFDPRLSTNPALRKQYAPEIQQAEQEDAAIARENQRQQQEAARAEAAAQREADKIARETARQQQINANVQAESQFKQEGRPYYKSDDGRIVPEVDDATFAAQKAKDAARKATELKYKQEGRRFTKDAEGDPVPLDSDEALAQRRKDEAEQIRRETLTKQMQAITAEAGVRKPPLRDTDRQKLEAELQRTRENATYALQPILGARAKATDKAGWWDIANNNPTPEAQRASERLARLTQPDADLDDEDLADLEADPTTKPTAATLRSLREQLAADDEARNGQESTRQTLADLLFRRDAPDKWEAAQRQKLAALDAPGLQKHLESADAALNPRLADFEARAQQAEMPLVQLQQEQETLNAENEQVKSRGIPAAELVTLSDGSTWHAPLAKKLLGLQAKAQALEPEVMQSRKALEVEQAEIQREINLRNEAATLAQQRATTERQTQLARVSFTPGMESTAQTLNALDAQRAQRQQQLTQRYPEGVPPEVQTAMEQDLQQQAEMSQAQGQQRHAAALAAYAGVRQRLSDDPSLNATAGELVVEAQRNLAAALQISQTEAGNLIDDVESLDWTTTQGKHGEVSEGTDNFRRDTRTHRILSNGGLVINPRLLTQPEAYLAAIDAAPASEEAKAAARAQLPDQRRLFGEQALAAFQAYAPSGFEAWRKKRAGADKAFAQLDAIDQATAYADHLRANEGPVGRLLDQIIRRSATGVMALGSQALGIAAGITGSETLMGGAQAIDQYAGASRAMQNYTGANDALGNRIVGQLAEIVPSTAASLGGGALARGGLMAFARTGLGARLLTSMSAGLRTAKTSADAARAMQGLMQTAGLTGAAAAGGAQTYGAQLGDIYGALRDQGLSHEEALSSAQVPALLSGAVTSVLTLLGGATGAEKLLANPETARKLAGNRFQNIAKSFFTEGVKELPEEILDEVFSTVSAELAKNPQASIPEVLAQFAESLPELAASVFLLGGAGGAISTARQPNDATPPPPAPAALPEDIAAAEAAIDAYAPEGFDEATTARAQATARALLYIAQGDMDSLPDSDLALVGLGRGKDGQLENIKTDDGQPPRVKVENGQPIITQATLDKLADQLPEVRGVIQLDEVTRRQQIQTQAQAETASPNPGPTEEKPAPAPAPEATPTPGTPQENQPNDPRAQRVTEFTNHFQDLGMPAADAALVAAHLVEKQGVVGESYIEQAVTGEYPKILRALGITGSLNPSKSREQPLKAPADLSQRLASQSQANAAPLSPAPKDPSTTAAPAPEAAPVMESPSARGASGQGPATSAQGGVGSPQGAAVAPPATAAPDYLDALNVARQKAIARVPAASRKRFLAFFGGLDGALTKYEAAFPSVRFTDGAAAGLNYTGAGIMVETDGQGNPAALTVNLADLYFSAAAVIPDDGKPRSGQQARAFAAFAERAVLHELRHIAALKVIPGTQARGLWQALSPALRTRVYASYYAPDIARAMNLAEGRTKPADFRRLSAKELLDIATAKLTTANKAQFGRLDLDELPRADAWHMAHEFLRMLDEDAQFAGETSEAMDADPALGQKIIDFLRAVIGEIKRLIDTDLDAPTRVQVREMQKLVEGARKKILASLPKPDPALKGTRPADNLATTGDTRASVLAGSQTTPAPRQPLTPVLGSTGTAFTDANDAIEYRWAVVEVNALNISNGDDGRINPDYPQELQPRDRTSAGSEVQVADIAKNLNLDRLSTSSGVGDGAPIIGEDGVVESGNGRIMGARRAYQQSSTTVNNSKQPSTVYRAALIQRAAEFGLDPAQVQTMTAPVLVRLRTTPVDRVAFVLAANVSTIAPKREIEQAKIDAKQIVPDLFSSFVPSEEGDIFTPANADFIRGFIAAIIPPAERPSIIDAKGNLTQTGLRRIRNALFVHAYGDSSETLNALSRLTETIDGSGNAVTNALVALAPRFAEQNARIASGALYPLSLTEDLAWAVQKLQDLRNRGEKVTDYLAQDGIPGIDDIATPLQRDILVALEAQKQSPRQLTAILDRYARAIDGLGDPKQATLFGEEPRPTREELWKLAQKTPTTLAKGRTTVNDGNPPSTAPSIAPKNALKLWRTLTERQKTTPLTPGQSQALEQAERALGQLFLFDDTATSSLKPAEDLRLEQETTGQLSRNPEQLSLFMSSKAVEPAFPRASMPQIATADRAELIRYLQALNIRTRAERVPASSLKPSQAEILPNKVAAAAAKNEPRFILISSDSYVLDGHHQWAAAGTDEVPVVRLSVPVLTALAALDAFPGNSAPAPTSRFSSEEYPYLGDPAADWRDSSDPEAGIVNPAEGRTADARVTTLMALSRANIPIVESILNQIRSELQLAGKWSLKEPDRILAKASRPSIREEKPWHDVVHVRDGLRFKVALNTFEKMPEIVRILRQNGVEVIKFDHRKMFHPKAWGWRFVAWDLRMPNGQLIEFYAPIPELEAVKKENHLIFEKWRNLPVADYLNDEAPRHGEYARDVERSYRTYKEAFLNGLKRMGYADLSAASAAWDSLVARSESSMRENFSMSATGSGAGDLRQTPASSIIAPGGETYTRLESSSSTANNFIVEDSTDRDVSQLPMARKSVADTGPDLFSFNNGLGLDALLTPAQKERKFIDSQQLDLFGDTTNARSRSTNQRSPQSARSPRTSQSAETASGLGDLFGQTGMAATAGGSRPIDGELPGLTGGSGGGGDNAAGGGTTRQPGADTGTGNDTQDSPGADMPGLLGDVGDSDAVLTRPSVGDPARNFEVPDNVESLAPATDKAKILANIEAIRLLKELEENDREATPEEKTKLASYTGWGAFKEAFNSKYEEDISSIWDRPGARRQYMPDWLQSWERNHRPLHKLLKENMTDDEFASASASTLNAHYTAVPIIRAMWKMVERLGFTGGRALEPSAGAGHYLGLTPPAIADKTQWQTVELDDLSARLLSKLYPEATVNEERPSKYGLRTVNGLGFERARIPNGSLDLIISNVPFHESGPKKKGFPNLNLHNFFFAHALDKVKPGGLVAFITSESTMQNNMKQRDFIASKGDLVAAFRLPNNAFKGNAGTEVTTDIIILRKPDGKPFQGKAWRNLVEIGRQTITLVQGKDQTADELRREAERTGEVIGKEYFKGDRKAIDVSAPIMVNEYFVNHPQHALGNHTLASTMYRAGGYALVAPDGLDVPAVLNALAGTLTPLPVSSSADTDVPDIVLAGRDDKPFSFKEQDGKLYEVQPDGSMEEAEWSTNPEMVKTWRSWKRVSLAVEELVTAENSAGASDDTIEDLRRALNVAYDTHIATHKPISRRFANTHKHLRSDPGYPLTAALENEVVTVDAKTSKKTYTYKKAEIFTKRIGRPIVIPTKATSVDEALEMSLAWKGHIDPAYGASLLGSTVERFEMEALQRPDIFRNPETGTLEQGEEYLAGNVRQKLEAAQEASKDDPAYQRNVEALTNAQPERKDIARISPVLGARWIPAPVYNAFIKEVLQGNDTVEYIPAGNSWIISGSGVYATEEHGTERAGPFTLFKHALNMSEPLVYDGSGENRTFNPSATAAAKVALDKMRRAFIDFVKTSDTQVQPSTTNEEQGTPISVWQLTEDAFNESNNSYVTPKHSGAYLKFPGLNTDYVYTKAHRRSVIARFLTTRRGMMAHGVGSGKTFNQIILAQELRRLGLAKKPMIVVQNSTLGQFAKSYLKAYPGAKILVPTKSDFQAENRRKIVAKIATGNWDAIILPHSQFDLISNKDTAVKAYMDSQIDELMAIVTKENDKAKVRDLEGMIKRLKDRRQGMLDRLKTRQDTAVMWEDLGIDALIMDEAHKYKSLPIITRMGRVKGVPASSNSQAAINFMLKCRDVQSRTGGKNIFLATGTPIKNSMAEAYIMMQFMAPDILEDFHIHNFDDFATSYGQTITEAEMAWGGTPKMETRFAKFHNGPTLVTLIRTMFDVAFGNDALGLDVPKIKGGEPEMVIVPATPAIDQFNAWVRNVSELWKNADSTEKEEFTAVPIQTMAAGIAAALDPRMLAPNLPDDPGSKVNEAVRRVSAIYKAGMEKKTTQIIFSDLRNPFSMEYLMPFTGHPFPEVGSEGTFDLYEDIQRKLIAQGVPAKEIHLMKSGLSDTAKAALFEKVDAGEVRIIIGSTELLGVGVNIQTRLKAVHHLMPPRDFTPAMMEQRNGRIIRQGNLHAEKVEGKPAWNEEVEVVNYGTEGSMDSAIYGTLARKQRFITQLLMGEEMQDTFDDPTDPVAMNMAEMAARTLGDPDFIRRIELEKEIKDLRLQYEAFTNEIAGKRSRLARLDAGLSNSGSVISDLEKAIAIVEKMWQRTAPRPEGVKADTDITDKAVYEFGGQTIDTAAKDGAITSKLDLWLLDQSTLLERRGQTQTTAPLTINGRPITVRIHQTIPGSLTGGEVLNSQGNQILSFSGAASLIQNVRRLPSDYRDRITYTRQAYAQDEVTARNLRALLANIGTFPETEKLAALEREAQEVDARLRAKSAPPEAPAAPSKPEMELPPMKPVDTGLMTYDVEQVIDNADIIGNKLFLPETLDRKLYKAVNAALESAGGRWSKRDKAHLFAGDPRPYLGLAPMPPLAMGSKSVYDSRDEQAAPNQDRLDRRTAYPTRITSSRVTAESGQALRDEHFARLTGGALRPDSTFARPIYDWSPGPRLAAELAQAFSAPILTPEQEADISSLPINDEGVESMVYLDRPNGVIYKKLKNHAENPAGGIWPQVTWADNQLAWHYQPAHNPRAVGVRLAVMADLGGTPTEVAAIGQDGHLYLKQPLSPNPGIASSDPAPAFSARMSAGLVEVPSRLLRPGSPRAWVGVVNSRPWLVLDLHPDNFIGDNQTAARINDPVIGVISMDVIQNVPGLGAIVRQAATEAQRLGDRANRLFMASKALNGEALNGEALNNRQQPSTAQSSTSPPSPLAKLGWNHLDRSLSAKLAALTRWMDAKTSAGQTVAKWLQAENARPFVALGHVLKREFFPDSVLPREIAARKREMEIKTALGSQRAMDMVRALTSTPKFSDIAYPAEFAKNPAWRRKLYLAMTGETPMTALPQELQDLAKRLRGQLIDMGREAVKQKRMSLETFENLQAGYMPHYYKEDVQKEKSLFQRFRLGLRDILAQRTTAWHIVDLETKDSSGEPRLVSWQGNQWRFRGQEHRDAFFEDFILEQALEQITNRNGKANRNLTLADLRAPAKLPEETRGRLKEILRTLRARYRKEAPLSIEQQEKAGLIMDPVYAIARYTTQMVHDNSTAEFFNFVADNKGWTSDTPTPGFTEIPDNPRFGRLAGKHVTDDVARQLLEMVEAPNIALQIYDSLMGWWKTGKTVLNPGTHVRNVLGNIFFSQLAGTSLWNPGNVTYYWQAITALRNGGADLQEAYEKGVLGADFVSAELRQTLRQLLPDPATIANDGKPDILLGIGKAIGKALPEWAKNPAHKAYNQIAALYQAEDEVFKLAAYLKARAVFSDPSSTTVNNGKPPSTLAAEHVRQWFPYFDSGTSGTLKVIGRTAMPFLGFYRESIRIFGHALKERPLSLAAGLAVPSLITFLSAMILGLEDDELEQVRKDQRGKAGKLLGPTPLEGMPLFSMLLPVRSDQGQLQQFDISAVHPFVDFLGNRVEGGEGEDWWQKTLRSLVAAGPIGSLIYSQTTGKDSFGDRTFVENNMTSGEKIAARVDNVVKTALPPLFPGGTGFTTLTNAGTRQTNKTLETRSPTQAVLRAVVGVDVRNATPNLYRIADDWRKAQGLPTTEGMDYGGTTPVSRARAALFAQLAQDRPNETAIANIKRRLVEMGSPIRTPQDVQRLLFYRDPLMIIRGKENQARFRASLTALERETLNAALIEYEKIKQRAPALLLR